MVNLKYHGHEYQLEQQAAGPIYRLGNKQQVERLFGQNATES
jgi:hypothetical protein